MIENLTNTPIPTFADSLLKFQFSASNSEISLFRYFIGGVEGSETPKFFKEVNLQSQTNLLHCYSTI